MALIKNPFRKNRHDTDNIEIDGQAAKIVTDVDSEGNIHETIGEMEYVPLHEQTISLSNALYNLHMLHIGNESSMKVKDFINGFAEDDYPKCWDLACDLGKELLEKITEEKSKADNPFIPEDPELPRVDYTPEPIDANVGVFVSHDAMEAWITVYPPYFDGEHITVDGIKGALAAEGVVWGIDELLIDRIAEEKSYLKLYLVAKGEEMIDGLNGEAIPFVEIHDTKAPKADEKGKVDFKNLGWIALVEKDQKICEIVPPTMGKDGCDVRGVVKKSKDGRAVGRIGGKNTYYSEDGRFLFSACDGQIVKPQQVYLVTEVLTIQGDVDYSTGNVEVQGSVIVKGNVSKNFTVKAKYDIVVEGIVDSATLISGGNILILGGVVGSDGGGMITCGGDLKCNFMEYGKAYIFGDAYFDNLVLSEISCEGNVYATEGRAIILGGVVTAMKNVEAGTLGNQAQCRTIIKICATEKFEKERQEILDELEVSIKYQRDIDANIKKIKSAAGDSNNPEVAKMLATLTSAASIAQMKTTRLRERAEEMEVKIHRTLKGTVIVNKAHPHVNVQIGYSIEKLRSDVDYSAFRLIEGRVECVPK